MRSNVENLGALKRRLDITASQEKIQIEVEKRLKRLAKTAKIHGFRPGKVPLKIIARQYGLQLQQDVLNDMLQKEFDDAVKELNLRIAGYPHFEAKQANTEEAQYTFSVIFEVYPDIVLGDLSQKSIEQPLVQVNADDIDKTLEIVRKQRVEYRSEARPAMKSDRVNINYHGVIDGNDIADGKAENINLILGEGKFLKDFEESLIGMDVGQNKSFEITFPENYHGKEIAGKTVSFEVKINAVEAPILPEIDAEFAKLLGIEDGSIEKMREEIRSNLEREVSKRVKIRLKEQIMQSLLDTTQIEAPKFLVDQELDRLMQNTRDDLEARGMKTKEMPISRDLFQDKAEYRVKLGLILAELVKIHELKAQSEQVRRVVEDAAQGYENPDEVIKWHYAASERLKEAESIVLEDNVVNWALQKVKVVDKAITFDELMGIS